MSIAVAESRAAQLRRWVARLLTTADLARAFGRDPQTIDLWRKGRCVAVALPAVEIPGRRRDVRFDPDEVRAWARTWGVRMVQPL